MKGNDLLGNTEYMATLIQKAIGGGGVRNAYSEVSDLESDAEVDKNIFSVSHSQVSELTDQDMQEWLSEIGYKS